MAADVGDGVEFPILCETCLGDNPYVRMTREANGRECKVCTRPFTVFRWLPGRGMRYKKTEICPTCAKLKNVCQTCILDLEHGLPVQARDAALGIESSVPQQAGNRRDYAARTAGSLEVVGGETDFSGRADPAGREMLKRMARKGPYYKRNRAHVCSFFVRGLCTRGSECPYRHEMPEGDPELSKQNLVDRYHGNNDPVARRMLARASKRPSALAPPEDKSITTLFVMGVEGAAGQRELHDHFGAYGELKSVSVASKGACAFVNFTTRAAAEAAAQAAQAGCVVAGQTLRVAWGKPRPKGPSAEASSAGAGSGSGTSGRTARIPAPPGAAGAALYPSQDPTAHGASAGSRA
ncbi:Pre-mRNA-splicing factor slt11 [Coemansia nantahalensis]|uniref:Pre-mRNA-splicing factor slt11 n=1 Tax=Coemansia nantahalensis TaxID=2789366 RepID=A0ACC1JWX4_9FUNG|nr:Pre-mRNA-splicing factor slt11 [Coemansia nantahalensis]